MKLSNYNEYHQQDETLIIYNSISSGVLALNKDYQKALDTYINTGECGKKDLIEGLKKACMIIDDDVNEEKMLELSSKINRYSTENLSLTVATTSGCNFRCPYCYEDGIQHYSMGEETQNDLIKFIDNQKFNKLSITWYGGEPLLNFNCIEKISNYVINKYKGSFSAAIVTNGYYLDTEIAKKLKQYKVQRVQITIDGPKVFHDQRRILVDGSGTYDTILSNIKNCCDILPIVIRMNVDKTNIKSVPVLIDELKQAKIYDKVSFYISPVDDINSLTENPECFHEKEFSIAEREYFYQFVDQKLIKPPTINTSICGAVCLNSYVIDPRGLIFKCWDDIGRDKLNVGTLKHGIMFNENLIKWLDYDPIKENPECAECQYLPVCFGGCPNQILKRNRKRCNTIKYSSSYVVKKLFDANEKRKEDRL